MVQLTVYLQLYLFLEIDTHTILDKKHLLPWRLIAGPSDSWTFCPFVSSPRMFRLQDVSLLVHGFK